MSDRPTGANGKRNQSWGSTMTCPDCGRCLCFACHPEGPCLDEQASGLRLHEAGSGLQASGYRLQATGFGIGWALDAAPPGGSAGVRIES